MESFQDRKKRIEKLLLDPFKPHALREELESLLRDIPHMSEEELKDLSLFLESLKIRLEENYNICFGWMEEVLKKGFKLEA
ncbi:MAG: hypothetical protein ACK4VK_04480 [Aquificaceae bacterium]